MSNEFPLVEVFGYAAGANTPEAQKAAAEKWCPFSNTSCEKYRQYRFGYCSVTYAAVDDGRVRRNYAVCDHRLDGAPLKHVVADYFQNKPVELVPEIVLTNPRTSFDFVAYSSTDISDVIAIETQAIDIRGGGVGPAWQAWADGKAADWRQYFTDEAIRKGRKDTVAYGVNMANIYKRLGLQVAVKGTYLKGINVPFYVLMQDRPFEYLRNRIRFEEAKSNWDISFVTFDYTGKLQRNGQLEFAHVRTIRATVESYVAAMSSDNRMAAAAREDFLERIKRKAGLR